MPHAALSDILCGTGFLLYMQLLSIFKYCDHGYATWLCSGSVVTTTLFSYTHYSVRFPGHLPGSQTTLNGLTYLDQGVIQFIPLLVFYSDEHDSPQGAIQPLPAQQHVRVAKHQCLEALKAIGPALIRVTGRPPE